MRVLIVCQYYYPENVVIAPIAEELAKRGHEVSVITGLPNYGYPDILPGYKKMRFETINHVKVYRVKLHPRKTGTVNLVLNYLSFWKNSVSFIKRFHEDFDLVYSMCLSPITAISSANVYSKKHNVPHILHCLDLWPESPVATGAIKRDSFVYKILFRLSKNIYSKTSRILISSPSFESYLRNTIGLKDKDIRFVPQPPLVMENKAGPIVYDGKFNIVYAGNIGTLQMVEEFVKAVFLLPIEYKDVQFHIIGSGQRLNEVLSLIKRYSLEKKVIYHGLVPSEEVGRYLKGAELIFMGLKFESDSAVSKTIPNKVISDLYFGKPIVASISGDGEKVLASANGSFFAGGTPEEIETALEEALSSSKGKLEEMGKNNRDYFDKHFSFSKVMDQLEEEFKDNKKE